MKLPWYKIGLTIIGVAVAAALWRVEADREYINLPPVEGTAQSSVLASTQRYEQAFIARRPTIARVGLHLRPAQRNLPAIPLTLAVRRGETVLGTRSIPANIIDSQGATQVRFEPPLSTVDGEAITIALSVPPELDGQVRALQRSPDPTFDSRNVVFTVNGEVQAAPLAYQVYYRYASPVIRTLAVLAALAVVYLWQPKLIAIFPGVVGYAGVLSAAALLPAWINGDRPVGLFLALVAALLGMWLLGQHARWSLPARLLAMHAYAFTSWFALHAAGGRWLQVALGALLPLAAYAVLRLPRRRAAAAVALSIVALAVLAAVPSGSPYVAPGTTASLIDIFLDPNQVPSSQKTADPTATWDHFGAYLGVVVVALSLIGITARGRRQPGLLLMLLLALAVAVVPPISLVASTLPHLPSAHLIIVAAFGLAAFAAYGLDALWAFLGRTWRVAALIVGTLVLLALLDGLQVLATTLEFGRL